MKNVMRVFFALAMLVSLVAYGCHASGSVGTNNMQSQKPASATR